MLLLSPACARSPTRWLEVASLALDSQRDRPRGPKLGWTGASLSRATPSKQRPPSRITPESCLAVYSALRLGQTNVPPLPHPIACRPRRFCVTRWVLRSCLDVAADDAYCRHYPLLALYRSNKERNRNWNYGNKLNINRHLTAQV